jgi:hypothetical protein
LFESPAVKTAVKGFEECAGLDREREIVPYAEAQRIYRYLLRPSFDKQDQRSLRVCNPDLFRQLLPVIGTTLGSFDEDQVGLAMHNRMVRLVEPNLHWPLRYPYSTPFEQ